MKKRKEETRKRKNEIGKERRQDKKSKERQDKKRKQGKEKREECHTSRQLTKDGIGLIEGIKCIIDGTGERTQHIEDCRRLVLCGLRLFHVLSDAFSDFLDFRFRWSFSIHFPYCRFYLYFFS